jgi:tetratricopeptide (TPR) repeat protein
MRAALEEQKFSDAGRALLHFALGKIFDDLADYETAIRHFDEANRLKRAEQVFDESNLAAVVDRSIGAFPKEEVNVASESELPILIVGMPRSGTTLTEQILASHPQVAAGGELDFWLRRTDRIWNQSADQRDPAAGRDAIRDYLALLTNISPAAPVRVTDKMPSNFLHLGLVHGLFPNARIIHCRRNPVDTALSIYFTHFARTHEFANSRNGIVLYYREYQRLMAHWRRVLPPDRFIEIDYERLITDQEGISRRLVAFCGLEWDDACLDFHNTRRRIGTASAWQARQPLYRSSVERWRHYQPWLGEFRELLPQPFQCG